MRIMRIVNAIPNDHSNEANSDGEPSIAVNPQDPNKMVITAFTPPDSGVTNGPVYFSTDRGENWSLFFDVPGGQPNDQSVVFASTSNELYIVTLEDAGTQLDVMRSADPTAGTAFPKLETRANMDQPWVDAISVVGGTDNGKDRMYVGYSDHNSSTVPARVDVCLDALASSPTFSQVNLESRSAQRDGFHIRPVPHKDGTVYAGFQSWQSQSGTKATMNMVVCRDDNWGSNSFTDLTDPSDKKSGRIVASVVIDEGATLGGQRADNGFDIKVDPNDSDIVYISWIDNSGPNTAVRVRRSLDRGANWSGDLITADNAALATMAINSQGTVALAYLQLVSGNWETHFRTTIDGTTWDDTVLARTATNGFVGDYMRMVAIGPHFYGVFPAMNTPDPANFFPNGGGTFRFQRNTSGKSLVGTDGKTTVSASVDPFFYKVEEKDVTIILNRNPIGQDEIDARRKQPRNSAGGLPIQDAIRVVVDGFTAAELGVTGPSSTLNLPSPLGSSMPITCTGNTSDTGNYGTEVQRFTFFYSVDFDSTDTAFNFTTDTEDVTLNVTAGTVPGSAILTLIKQPDPFLLHGDPSWLSIDLRVFVVRQGESMFGVPGISGASDATRFIQQLMTTITPAQFDSLSADEDQSKLYVQPNDENNVPVFNFALAKVHYIGLIGAPSVRVFFRLFQAQSTTSTFDYPPGVQYRRATSNPDGQPIALAGIIGSEYVTIPCFASGRVDTTSAGMDQQTDAPNVQTINAHTDGSEVDTIFGCWLDINQPSNNVLPPQVPPKQDGPFDINDSNPQFRPVPIQQSILKNLHQCLIAEIAFDPTPIPLGKDSSNWDKLAQRNIAWSDAGSAQAVTTFEIRPTRAGLPAGQTPDELMIDWGNVPNGSAASIYLPAVSADIVLAMAARMYTTQKLTRVDDHTVKCKTGGITYIPVPPGTNVNYAGLLSVDLPNKLPRGEVYNVVVRQLTNAFGRPTPPPPPPPQVRERKVIPEAVVVREIEWRRVLGAFQLTIPVHPKGELLLREERDLSVLLWIAEAIPNTSRWYPVFLRYLKAIGGRVTSFGGDPTQILPSPTGDGRKHPCPVPTCEERLAVTGKITGLIFDHFGDFEGFLLETEECECRFHSREREMKELVESAWRERLRITVWFERCNPHRPLSIIVRVPPSSFED